MIALLIDCFQKTSPCPLEFRGGHRSVDDNKAYRFALSLYNDVVCSSMVYWRFDQFSDTSILFSLHTIHLCFTGSLALDDIVPAHHVAMSTNATN